MTFFCLLALLCVSVCNKSTQSTKKKKLRRKREREIVFGMSSISFRYFHGMLIIETGILCMSGGISFVLFLLPSRAKEHLLSATYLNFPHFFHYLLLWLILAFFLSYRYTPYTCIFRFKCAFFGYSLAGWLFVI